MGVRVHRVTMFKLPDPENQKRLIEAYHQMAKDQRKDGKPYILALTAGVAHDDARAQGYTIVAKSEFASLDDMRYYDAEDESHAALKKTAAALGLQEPPLTVYFTGEPQVAVKDE